MGFLVICTGITILQMSKVDPESLSKLDRRSTILLKAARSNTESVEEKSVTGIEDPGMDTLRGSFGTLGSIIRARSARRMSMSGGPGSTRHRAAAAARALDQERSWPPVPMPNDGLAGMKRHQLYDAPVPRGSFAESQIGKSPTLAPSLLSPSDTRNTRQPTIKFDNQEVVHSYHPPGQAGAATHEHRDVASRDGGMPYPPIPSFSGRTNTSEASSSKLDGRPVDLMSSEATEQTVTVPSLLLNLDGQIRSAPPTTSARYARRESSDSASKTPSTATLMSFPSDTDSNANSQVPWYEDEEESESSRGRSKKQRYPRGSREDDREESVSLWHRQPTEDEQPDDPSQGGIRLVQPRNPF